MTGHAANFILSICAAYYSSTLCLRKSCCKPLNLTNKQFWVEKKLSYFYIKLYILFYVYMYPAYFLQALLRWFMIVLNITNISTDNNALTESTKNQKFQNLYYIILYYWFYFKIMLYKYYNYFYWYVILTYYFFKF